MWFVGVAVSGVVWLLLSGRVRQLQDELSQVRERLNGEIQARATHTVQGSFSLYTDWQFPDTSKGETAIRVLPSALRLHGSRPTSGTQTLPRISVFAHDDEAGVIIRDPEGRDRLVLGVSGHSFVQLLDEEGNVEWGFPMELDEGQYIVESLSDAPRRG